jgi:hypothetical protein
LAASSVGYQICVTAYEVEDRVGGDDRRALADGLCHEQPIKGVVVD